VERRRKEGRGEDAVIRQALSCRRCTAAPRGLTGEKEDWGIGRERGKKGEGRRERVRDA